MNAELVHDSVLVAVDRLLRSAELCTDFFDTQPASQMSQNCELLNRQAAQHAGRVYFVLLLDVVLDESVPHGRRESKLTPVYTLQRVTHDEGGLVLQQVATRPHPNRL
jgi:hypothetical protein